MANKRTLKRAIHSICEDLFAEAIAVSLYGTKGQQGNAEALLFSILKVEDEFIRRTSHPEPGLSAKAYFDDLKENFKVQVSEIIDQLNG
jgi:hypothetical protein